MKTCTHHYQIKWCPNTKTSKESPTGDEGKVQEGTR